MRRFTKSPAHLIILLWAGAWAQFLIAEAVAWRHVVSATTSWIALGGVFLLLSLLPQRWEPQGGVLLLTCGIGLLLSYQTFPPTQLRQELQVLFFLLLAVPPLVTGLVFLSHGARSIRVETTERNR
jgi:hypothetical protein